MLHIDYHCLKLTPLLEVFDDMTKSVDQMQKMPTFDQEILSKFLLHVLDIEDKKGDKIQNAGNQCGLSIPDVLQFHEGTHKYENGRSDQKTILVF